MKSKDQILLEEAYEATKRGISWIKLGQDEKGAYREKLGDYGKPPLKSRLNLHDSEGNKLPSSAKLASGQIISDGYGPIEYFQVTEEDNEFIGKRFEPSREVANMINNQRADRVNKDEKQAMSHFFPKKS